jgi:hypothetical protein
MTEEQLAIVRAVVGDELLNADVAALTEAYANYLRGLEQLRAAGLGVPAAKDFEVRWIA